MHFASRNKRWPGGLGIALLLTVPVSLVPVAAAGAGSPSPSPQIPSVADARAAVASSEQRLAEVTAARDAARTLLASLDSTSAALADDLAAARAELRSRAVRAFISDEPDETVLVLLGGDDLFDASARRNLMTHAADRSRDAVERYDDLKREADPALVATAERLQRLEQDLADAETAVLAARATEAESERQAALREEAERQARAAVAATTTTAPAPTTAPATTAAPRVAADSVPAPAPAAPAPAPAPAAPAPLPPVPAGGPSEAQWAALRMCESGGNYRAVSTSGKYRGAYQFDTRTWGTLGGSGDPAAAPPAEQDARAKALYAQRSWRPWPVCGRHLR